MQRPGIFLSIDPGYQGKLLCFGKLDLMRDLIPARARRQRRQKVKKLPDLPVAEEVHREAGEDGLSDG